MMKKRHGILAALSAAFLTMAFSSDAQAASLGQQGQGQRPTQGRLSYGMRNRLPAVQISYSYASNSNSNTNSYQSTYSSPTGINTASNLPTQTANLSIPVSRTLPPTRLDSFVLNAGAHKEHIYGDEGADGIPPYMGFSRVHRINTGILGARDQGLTTGHGSYMPEAWGADEFIAPPGEWSNSGANNGNHNYNNASAALDSADQAQSSGAGGGQGQLTAADLAQHPSPGDGYQPMFQHGVFVGWWSPQEIALSQTDFPAALRSIVNSDRYWGGEAGKNSILYEIGDISSPF